VDQFPDPEYRKDLALYHLQLGLFLAKTARPEQAAVICKRSLELYRQLPRELTRQLGCRRELAVVHDNLGQLLGAAGQTAEAEVAFRQALAIREELAKEYPLDPDQNHLLACVLNNFAMLWASKGQHLPDARAMLERAVRCQQKGLEAHPEHQLYRSWLRMNYVNLAGVLLMLKDHAAAAAAAQNLAAASDDTDDLLRAYQALLQCRPLVRTDAKLPLPQRQETIRNYSRLCRQLIGLAAPRPDLTPAWANEFAWALANIAEPEFRDPDLAVKLAKRAIESKPNEGDYWNTLGAAHYRKGNYGDAISALEMSVSLRQGGDAVDFFLLAMAHQRLDKNVKARTYYDQAVAWMRNNEKTLAGNPGLATALRVFHREAADVLGIKDRPKQRPSPTPPKGK
jgi:tetratricopeptide (TPR) repeat protein